VILTAFKQAHMTEVLNLLSDISFYAPKLNHEQLFKQYIEQQNVRSLVALSAESAIGYGCIFMFTNIRGGKIGFIEDIVVKKEFRNYGVGSLIMESLIDIAKLSHCYKITLKCKSTNIVFYEKLGFKLNGNEMKLVL
jgi:GNAT superfamily N-acetyltransferase